LCNAKIDTRLLAADSHASHTRCKLPRSTKLTSTLNSILPRLINNFVAPAPVAVTVRT
jgi:hypothetical protein